MTSIIIPLEAVFHVLTHFSEIDSEIRGKLQQTGFTDKQIDSQLQTPGSKFYATFARSPQEIIDKLQSEFPEIFAKAQPDVHKRLRLSFHIGTPIGTCQVIPEEILTAEERATIRHEIRNGCAIRTVCTPRKISTDECQLILSVQSGSYYLCTLFPGELAPPLPKEGEQPDPYWSTHLFIDCKNNILSSDQ